MQTKLERIGLSAAEAEIYLALLRLGESKVQQLAQDTGQHRTNIYDTLEKLREKGLVSYVIKENVKYFSPAEPTALLDYLEHKEGLVKDILPQLEEKRNTPTKNTNVELFKGKEGLKTVLKDILRTGKDYVVLEETGHIHEVLPYFYPTFNEQLEEKDIHVRVLAQRDDAISTRESMQIRTLNFLEYPSATAIYGNKVAIFIWDKPYHAIQIQSEDVANSYRNFFESLWQTAESRIT